MEVSPVSSGARSSSSDFSIDRILSDVPKSDSSELPSWLCCTRYQPPKLTKSSSQNTRARVRRSGRHARVPFTGAQAAALEAAYARAPYLAPPALRALAAALNLRDDRIKIWFQNRRARERREKCSSIAPPHAVTLPATTRAGVPAARTPWFHDTATTSQTLAYSREFHLRDDRSCSSPEKTANNDESNEWSDSSLDIEIVDD